MLHQQDPCPQASTRPPKSKPMRLTSPRATIQPLPHHVVNVTNKAEVHTRD